MTSNLTDSMNLTAEEILFLSVSTPSPLLTKIHNGCLLFIILAVMLAMGADIQPFQIRDHLRRPFGVLVGMLCQFGFMPLAGFIMTRVLGVDGLYATGIMLVSCCPGGSISNILTFMANGEIALSVTMTAISTAVALGMMPLNMWIYGHALDTKHIVIPYANIAISLVYVTSPVILGMIIRWRLPKIAPYITKIGGLLGFVVITALCLLEIGLFYEMYAVAPWTLYVAAFLLLPLGFCMGYCVAWLFRQNSSIRRTVGIESGVQNAALAITIAYMSFQVPGYGGAMSPMFMLNTQFIVSTYTMYSSGKYMYMSSTQLVVRLYPVLYGICQAIVGFIACGVYRVVLYVHEKTKQREISTVDKALVCRYMPVRENSLTEKLLIGDSPLCGPCVVQITPVSHAAKIRQK